MARFWFGGRSRSRSCRALGVFELRKFRTKKEVLEEIQRTKEYIGQQITRNKKASFFKRFVYGDDYKEELFLSTVVLGINYWFLGYSVPDSWEVAKLIVEEAKKEAGLKKS